MKRELEIQKSKNGQETKVIFSSRNHRSLQTLSLSKLSNSYHWYLSDFKSQLFTNGINNIYLNWNSITRNTLIHPKRKEHEKVHYRYKVDGKDETHKMDETHKGTIKESDTF